MTSDSGERVRNVRFHGLDRREHQIGTLKNPELEDQIEKEFPSFRILLQAVGGDGRNQCRDGIDCFVVLANHQDPDDIRTADNRGVLDQIRIAVQLLVQDLLGHVEEDVRDLVPNVESTGIPVPVAQCIPANLDFTNHMVVGERVDGFGVDVRIAVRSCHS